MTTTRTATESAEAFRLCQSRLRGIARNGGRTAATTRARTGWEFGAQRYMEELLAGGHRELAGLLTEEAATAERLRTDPNRPELKARQVATRRRIRAALEEV